MDKAASLLAHCRLELVTSQVERGSASKLKVVGTRKENKVNIDELRTEKFDIPFIHVIVTFKLREMGGRW